MNFNWKGFGWCARTHNKHNFGRYENAYFSEEGVRVDDEKIELFIVNKQRIFTGSDGCQDGISRLKTYGCGEVTGNGEFSYGTYEWLVSLPHGTRIWPALWLTACHRWPPEIDAMEGYPNSRGEFFDGLFRTSLETNVHYWADGQRCNIGGKGFSSCAFKNWSKKQYLHRWVVEWTPERITILINGKKIREVNDKIIIEDFNRDPKMYPVMNMMTLEDFCDDDLKMNPIMTIYDFKYEAL